MAQIFTSYSDREFRELLSGRVKEAVLEALNGEVTEKEQSAVLDAQGMRHYDIRAIIEDFNTQRKLRPSLGKAVGHAVLSWSNEDRPKLTVEKMAAHAREYLQKMGISDTQYLTVLHTDRTHTCTSCTTAWTIPAAPSTTTTYGRRTSGFAGR